MILFASNHDYACFSHNMANAYRTAQSGVKDLTLHGHKFSYDSQSEVVKLGAMERTMEKATQIHIMHSDPLLLQMAQRWGKKAKLIHWATGSRYRQNPEKYNNLFNPYVEMTVIALTEFEKLGAKNPHYIVGAIDTDRIRHDNPYTGELPEVYHLPSCAKTKGTDNIFQIVRGLKGEFNFEYKLTASPYETQLSLMQQSDIYLELFAPKQNGKPYGSWGITALEAAAMGKIVFTQMNRPQLYKDTYGIFPPLIYRDSITDFRNSLQSFIDNPHLIKKHQQVTRDWVVQCHSYRATGKKMQKLFAIYK